MQASLFQSLTGTSSHFDCCSYSTASEAKKATLFREPLKKWYFGVENKGYLGLFPALIAANDYLRGLSHLDAVLLGKHGKPKKQVFPRTSFLKVLFGAKRRTFSDRFSTQVPSEVFREPTLREFITEALGKLSSIGLRLLKQGENHGCSL